MANIVEEFTRLARTVSAQAAAVDCTPAAHRAGLRLIVATLEMDLAVSEATDPDPDRED